MNDLISIVMVAASASSLVLSIVVFRYAKRRLRQAERWRLEASENLEAAQERLIAAYAELAKAKDLNDRTKKLLNRSPEL